MAFTATNKMPGVYIDEILVPGPIAGVATSVLAVVGPANRKGPINEPTLVTSPTQFSDEFGDHMKSPVYYTSHAVHGFFENGGSLCYFVRVGTGAHASLEVLDQATPANTTLVVTALGEGDPGNNIRVEVQHPSATDAARGQASVAGAGTSGNQAPVDDGSQFRPGDVLLFDDGGGTTETATVESIDGNDLTLTADLAATFTAGATVRVADLEAGRQSLRVDDSADIEPGSHVEISQGGTSEQRVVDAVDGDDHVLTLAGSLVNTYTMAGADPPVVVQATAEFTLIVSDTSNPLATETFKNLSMDTGHRRYFATVIGDQGSSLVSVALADDPPNPSSPPTNVPDVAGPDPLTGGQNDDPSSLTAGHYQAGIDALERVDEVTMLVIPDRTDLPVQGAMITHCEKMQDRFAILDSRRGDEPTNGVDDQRSDLNSDNGYAALYYPWIWVNDPDPNVEDRMLVPPSGHIAGVFARTDDTKGVHKAPANEQLRGVLDLERRLTEVEAGLLNEDSINVLRRVPNRGFRIWGARTLTESTQWRYVSVRRLLLFIEESIQEGTEFAVFEPNNRALWETVKRQVVEFLTTVWATGAFVGATPEESFRVRVDEELNPPGQIALGILTFEVIVYPAPPAEFIVFRVIQEPGGPRVEEA